MDHESQEKMYEDVLAILKKYHEQTGAQIGMIVTDMAACVAMAGFNIAYENGRRDPQPLGQESIAPVTEVDPPRN